LPWRGITPFLIIVSKNLSTQSTEHSSDLVQSLAPGYVVTAMRLGTLNSKTEISERENCVFRFPGRTFPEFPEEPKTAINLTHHSPLTSPFPIETKVTTDLSQHPDQRSDAHELSAAPLTTSGWEYERGVKREVYGCFDMSAPMLSAAKGHRECQNSH
jgi:hypothetical protein